MINEKEILKYLKSEASSLTAEEAKKIGQLLTTLAEIEYLTSRDKGGKK